VDRLKARVRLLRGRITTRDAAAAARLKAAEVSAVEGLEAARAAAAAQLKAAEAAGAAKLRAAEAAGAERLEAARASAAAQLKAAEAAGAAKLRAAEAAGAERLEAARASAADKLKAVEAAGAAELKAARIAKSQVVAQVAAIKQRIADARRVAGDPDMQPIFIEFLQHLAPRRVVGVAKVRLGGAADGGYVILDDFAGLRTAISGGIGTEVSWDLEIADRGIDVIQLDHTVAGPPVPHPRFDFRRRRLVGICEAEHDVTLSSLIEACPGADQSILCKLDIEGAEWDVFAEPVVGLGRCRQIVIEFHLPAELALPEWWRKALRCVGQITAEHQCIHVHGNNVGAVAVIGGLSFPSMFEATFVLRDRYAFEDETDVFPTALDAPNDPARAELYLGVLPRRAN
jgi:hypothetical protein